MTDISVSLWYHKLNSCFILQSVSVSVFYPNPFNDALDEQRIGRRLANLFICLLCCLQKNLRDDHVMPELKNTTTGINNY